MRIIEHNEDRYGNPNSSHKYVHLYESLEKPGYYLVELDFLGMGMLSYHVYNHTGIVDWGNGHPQAKTLEPISVGPFHSNLDYRFEWFIKDNYVEEHIPHERSVLSDLAWFKFKSFEPEQWLDDFINYLKLREAEYDYKNDEPLQLSLF